MNGSGVSGGGVSLVVTAAADTVLREPQLEYMVATCVQPDAVGLIPLFVQSRVTRSCWKCSEVD